MHLPSRNGRLRYLSERVNEGVRKGRVGFTKGKKTEGCVGESEEGKGGGERDMGEGKGRECVLSFFLYFFPFHISLLSHYHPKCLICIYPHIKYKRKRKRLTTDILRARPGRMSRRTRRGNDLPGHPGGCHARHTRRPDPAAPQCKGKSNFVPTAHLSIIKPSFPRPPHLEESSVLFNKKSMEEKNLFDRHGAWAAVLKVTSVLIDETSENNQYKDGHTLKAENPCG